MTLKASKVSLASAGVLGALALCLSACPASLDDRCSAGACDDRGEGGSSGGEGGADADASVDPCLANPTADMCIDDTMTIFVSPNGNDSAVGGHKTPFKTLGAALKKLTTAKRRIYVCEGTYPEDVAIGAAESKLTVIGGFTCSWAPSKTNPTFGKTAFPLKITGAAAITLSALSFKAADAQGGSSIAAFVVSSDVTFQSVSLTAGNGANGLPGTLADFTLPIDLKGNSGDDGGGPKSVSCPGGDTTIGGAGGASGVNGVKGSPGGTDNAGTALACLMSGAGGMIGGAGNSPTAAPGAASSGDLTTGGWQPTPGGDGGHGSAGQGGGGGGGAGGGTGGSGGAGGCGGAGGAGGAGGGGSIALAALQSTITINASTLATHTAGAGGAGAAGQAGTTPGGSRGLAAAAGGCNGGNGGPGGNGAAGGGGAGGVSVGILYKGVAPKSGPTTTMMLGAKGDLGAGPDNNAGVDGVMAAVLEVK